MPAYDDFLSFVVIRWCTSAARREVVERAFRERCHTHSYVGAHCVRWEILCMHKNSLRMPTYGLYAASTLCTRYANVPRVRGTVGVRWRNVHSTLTLVDTKCVNFTTSPLRIGSEFWTFCQRTVCVFSAYAYRIKIDSALVSFFIARSHLSIYPTYLTQKFYWRQVYTLLKIIKGTKIGCNTESMSRSILQF